MLGIGTLDTDLQGILWAASVVAFVLAAISFKIGDGKANLLGIGLALYVFPWAWNQLAAGD